MRFRASERESEAQSSGLNKCGLCTELFIRMFLIILTHTPTKHKNVEVGKENCDLIIVGVKKGFRPESECAEFGSW